MGGNETFHKAWVIAFGFEGSKVNLGAFALPSGMIPSKVTFC
jgi:hypothetical protein